MFTLVFDSYKQQRKKLIPVFHSRTVKTLDQLTGSEEKYKMKDTNYFSPHRNLQVFLASTFELQLERQ